MAIFEFSDYRLFIRTHFAQFPQKGRGQMMALAKHLRIHPSVVSQVFSGQREFSEEQAVEIAEMLELTPLEAKYLRLLVRLGNAGTQKLKSQLKLELEEIRQESRSLATRVQVERSLTDTERAVFYSSWLYSACRLYCSTDEAGRTLNEVSSQFGLTRTQAAEVMDFLTQAGLTVAKNDKYQMGPQSTFVERGSPFMKKHLLNWRVKSTQTLDRLQDDELMYSGPCSMSRSDFAKFREELAELIKKFAKTVEQSPADELACLNIDFFRVTR